MKAGVIKACFFIFPENGPGCLNYLLFRGKKSVNHGPQKGMSISGQILLRAFLLHNENMQEKERSCQ